MSYAFPPALSRIVQERLAAGGYGSEEALLFDAMVAFGDVESRRETLRSEIRARLLDAGQGLSTPLDPAALKTNGRLAAARNGTDR